MPVDLNRSFGDKVVNLVVGEGERIFIVHEALLRQHSVFFESATKEEWMENRDRTIPLPTDDPDVVDLYMQWIYTTKLPTRQPKSEVTDNDEVFSLLINAFVFGDKIQDGNFRDGTIDALVRTVHTPAQDGTHYYPGIRRLDQAYKGTMKGSPLRRLLTDMYVHHAKGDWSVQTDNCELLQDLTRELLDTRPTPSAQDPTAAGTCSCSYHHHGKDESCYSNNKGEESD